MHNNSKSEIDAQSLVFFGKITASVTHELKNVLSIIEQSAGLLDDICDSNETLPQNEADALMSVSSRIGKQVERGVDILTRLNYFAHSADEPLTFFELNVMMENIIGITQRFASLKKIHLENISPESKISIRSNAFLLEQTIFTSMQIATVRCQKECTVEVSTEQYPGGADIILTCPMCKQSPKIDDDNILLNKLVESLKANLEINDQDDSYIIRLSIPNLSDEVSYE